MDSKRTIGCMMLMATGFGVVIFARLLLCAWFNVCR